MSISGQPAPSLFAGLTPVIAKRVHPDWQKNETDYRAQRDTLPIRFADKWIGFAEGTVIASGTSPVEVFHTVPSSGKHPFVTCVGHETDPNRMRRASLLIRCDISQRIDHIGDQKLKALGAGTCANSDGVPAGPHSMTADVAAAKNSALVMTRNISALIAVKILNIRGGKPITFCPQADGAVNVPVAAVCRSSTDLGGVFIAKAPNAQQWVEITIVYASHANNVPPALLSEAQRTALSADGAGLDFGPPTGFVIKFTNGLTAYLSGDTGIHSEMKTVVNEYHKANLAVLNLGPNAGTVKSAAYAMNELVRPASVMLTHPNEAVTEGGKLRPASNAAALIKQLKGTAHLAISGRTMEFDGNGKCVAGC
jgi:hypothetical protein